MNRREATWRTGELLAALAATPLLARLGNAEVLREKGAALHAAPLAEPFLGKLALETVAVIAEHILPRTEGSPGATDSGCAAFIDRFLADVEPPFQLELTGDLSRIDQLCLKQHQQLFARAPAPVRKALLHELDAADPRTEPAARGFRSLKILTVFAHYTSEIGQHELGFTVQPGAYVGCTHPEHKRAKSE